MGEWCPKVLWTFHSRQDKIALRSAQPNNGNASELVTPNTPISTLEYKDGAPSKETVANTYDYLDQRNQLP